MNHQISGLAYRDGHLYAISDQSGVETSAILEIDIGRAEELAETAVKSGGASDKVRKTGDVTNGSESANTVTDLGQVGKAIGKTAHTTGRGIGAGGSEDSHTVDVRARCHWQAAPHPDAEGLALDPSSGPPRTALVSLESHADALLEVGFDDCTIRGMYPRLTGNDNNQGIEGVAVSPDGRTIYLVHETERTLLTLARGTNGPARRIAKITDAESLCDAAYDDRGTPGVTDDRLLLLDRNGRQIFYVTLDGTIVALWHLSRWPLQIDPEGYPYGMIALEGLAIESRATDGSLFVYAATDTPPAPLPYRRTKGPKDTDGFYERRVGMLYRFHLPVPEPPATASK